MGYPEDHLAAGENIIVNARPHWKRLIGSGLLFLVGTGLAIFLYSLLGPEDSTTNTVLTILIVVGWLVVAVIWGFIPFIRWFTTHFVITDRRIMFRTGVITRQGIDIPMARINSVQFRHGLIDRAFKTGTLVIESASDDPLEFNDIPNVEAVHKMLYEELYDELHDDGKN
ncbi:PH domain-containing protein [Demequina sp.]|uniref:PH domain-containing protein n=1 Tax=Demequina sp. TaxID=2050685 RepID=UPI003D13D593